MLGTPFSAELAEFAKTKEVAAGTSSGGVDGIVKLCSSVTPSVSTSCTTMPAMLRSFDVVFFTSNQSPSGKASEGVCMISVTRSSPASGAVAAKQAVLKHTCGEQLVVVGGYEQVRWPGAVGLQVVPYVVREKPSAPQVVAGAAAHG